MRRELNGSCVTAYRPPLRYQNLTADEMIVVTLNDLVRQMAASTLADHGADEKHVAIDAQQFSNHGEWRPRSRCSWSC